MMTTILIGTFLYGAGARVYYRAITRNYGPTRKAECGDVFASFIWVVSLPVLCSVLLGDLLFNKCKNISFTQEDNK